MTRRILSAVILKGLHRSWHLAAIAGVIAAATPIVVAAGKLPAIDGDTLLQHIKVLASDEFEGRAPGSKGEDRTVAYLEEQFRKMGLVPGNTDGTYIQHVPMVGITPSQDSHLTLKKGNDTKVLTYRDDVVAWTRHVVDRVSIADSELVFVGYGVQAPEFNWDDYKGVDVKGKTLVVLINDPAVPDPRDPSRLDPTVFAGKAMTYYGRWTYKYEIGAKLGAAAVLIVHETGPAAYPFSVVQNNANEQFDLATPDKNLGLSKVEGWITRDAAVALCQMAGQDFEALKKAAITRAFKPVPLGVTGSMAITTTIRSVDSRNVIAKLEGSDARLKDEYVIYTAHWDHLGIGKPVNGDRIYNGALDNASGTATLLEIARAFTSVQPAPKRSVLFLAVTAEEQGLLGAEYYASHPIYPLTSTVANINMDGANMFGRTRDITIVGLGASDLDDYLREAAKEHGRTISPDPEPEKGFYYRSDHFNFAKVGVPALYTDQGDDYVGKPAGYGKMVRDRYTTEDYHRPSDEVKPYWDVAGAVDDAGLLLDVGSRVANAATPPEWKPGNEFRRIREESIKRNQSR